MALYRRCKRFGTLPRSGGVFDQDETVMDIFDVIESIVEQNQRKRAEDQQAEAMKRDMLRRLPGGR